MISILVTGANGQVGNELQALAPYYPEFRFYWTDIDELDLTDADAINSFFESNKVDFVCNCAAYTAVDKAESHEELAQMVNVKAPELLAAASARHKAGMVHLSTDYVYHNDQNTPFQEGDPIAPKGVYARTKWEGDEKVRANNPFSLILRTSWVYSSFGHNFVKTMIRLGQEREQLGIIFDQIGTPTYARDLAGVILEIIKRVTEGEVSRKPFPVYIIIVMRGWPVGMILQKQFLNFRKSNARSFRLRPEIIQLRLSVLPSAC